MRDTNVGGQRARRLHGYGPEQVTADCGIDVGGGRQPDLTVWAKGRPPQRARSSYAGLGGLLLVIEVVSSDSEAIDRVIKKAEYATAGVPRFWIVDRDPANMVRLLRLGEAGYELEREPTALAWLLNQPPPDLQQAARQVWCGTSAEPPSVCRTPKLSVGGRRLASERRHLDRATSRSGDRKAGGHDHT